MSRLRIALILLCALFSFSDGSAQTESTAQVLLSTIQTESFPLVNPRIKVFSLRGEFIHGLSLANIKLYENGIEVPLQAIREQRVGVQAVFVLNPSGAFLTRDAQGITRYDYLMDGLVDWARRRLGSTIDDLSIVVTDGPSRSHLNNPLELFYTLASFRIAPDSTPTLDSLLKGIELAADPSPRFGMEKLVLFITAPPTNDQSIGIQNALEQARQKGVRVSVWLLTTPAGANPQAIDALKPLAEETQGNFWVLTKPADQPDPEIIFEPLRSVYTLRYLSSPEGGSERQLEAEVQIGEEVLRSQSITFRVDLQPPNLVFLSPPVEILRQPPENASGIATSPEVLEPRSYRFNLLTEFPDGRPRSITKLRVYVDDQMILERLEPPFDGFVWDLRDYTQSGQHVLQAEVTDELGMTAKTAAMPILVKVSRPLPSPSRMVNRNIPLIVFTLSVLVAASSVFALAMRGKLLPTSQRLSRRLGIQKKSPLDPLTQPITIPPLQPSKVSLQRRREAPSFSNTEAKPPVFAHLDRLGESIIEGETRGSFMMVTDELTMGSNAVKNLLVIDDPSVEGVHARLERQPDGKFRLYDLGSLMGTWVNYTPVSQEGVTLENGDLIHIGRVGFRFRVRKIRPTDLLTQPREENG